MILASRMNVRGVEVEAVVTVDVQLSLTMAMDVVCRWSSSDDKAVKRRRRSRPMKAALLRYHGVVWKRRARRTSVCRLGER